MEMLEIFTNGTVVVVHFTEQNPLDETHLDAVRGLM